MGNNSSTINSKSLKEITLLTEHRQNVKQKFKQKNYRRAGLKTISPDSFSLTCYPPPTLIYSKRNEIIEHQKSIEKIPAFFLQKNLDRIFPET